MKFKNLSIKNFRNFENIDIELSNKNVVFGLNDVGKTNFLIALKFLFDRKTRNNGFQESDYFQKDISRVIEIELEILVNDALEGDLDSQNIISKMGKYRDFTNLDSIFIKVTGKFDSDNFFGNPELYWGNNENDLHPIPQSGTFSIIDKLFRVIYVDPLIDMDKIFSSNKKKIFNKKSQNDIQILNDVDDLAEQINNKIAEMDIISEFQSKLTEEYRSLKSDNIKIILQSEMAINGVFTDIHPYISRLDDEAQLLYPTSGDGRKKFLAYSLLNYVTSEFNPNNSIPIFLIDEPENSLHRSMQIALSKQLFAKEIYKYFFMATHSSEILYEMDCATLIRIHSDDKIQCDSILYVIDKEFIKQKKELNRNLATALFSDRVLLIEGPSERTLFERVLSTVKPDYESDGGYILQVDGIKFKPYYITLTSLGIKCIVKTDNDCRQIIKNDSNVIEAIGYNRCIDLAIKHHGWELGCRWPDVKNDDNIISIKNQIYKHKNVELLKKLHIILSKIDLENDLYEAIPDTLEKWKKNPVDFLQRKKLIRMVQLCDFLDDNSCFEIYEHENFQCLKVLTGEIK